MPSGNASFPARILTVSQLTRLIRGTLEEHFLDLWLEGEVSNLRAPGSGHLYCTLKDHESQIRVVLFRSTALRLRFALREGLQVIVRGRLTLYEPRGEYQLIVEYVEPKGIGALQLAFEQLKERLAAEGLFDAAKKRAIPIFPTTVGVVTSLTGAAVRDIATVLRRRCPSVSLLIAPVPVQGDGSAKLIAAAVDALSVCGKVDVIIVGRGGGSWEDLWSFNDEAVVRAIAASRVPVVSAVGHEVDVTLADFAADFRAPTPSAAAEAVVPVLSEIVGRLSEADRRVRRAMMRHCEIERHRLHRCLQGLIGLRLRIHTAWQRLDERLSDVQRTMYDSLSAMQERTINARHRVLARNPSFTIHGYRLLVPQLAKRLEHHLRQGVARRVQQVQHDMANLHSLSPLAILKRGYCILQTLPDGRVIRRHTDARVGQDLSARLEVGRLICTVKENMKDSSA